MALSAQIQAPILLKIKYKLKNRVIFRADLGDAGSFGGRHYQNQVITRQPVIFVHGVSNRARDQPLGSALYFKYVCAPFFQSSTVKHSYYSAGKTHALKSLECLQRKMHMAVLFHIHS